MKYTSTPVIILALFVPFLSSSCSKAGHLEDPVCSTVFTGEVVTCGANRSAVYRFTSATNENIVIQGDLPNYVGPDAIVTTTGGLLFVSQSAAANNTIRNIKVEGSVQACQEIVITISWSSTNYDNVISGNWTVVNSDKTHLAPAIPGLECDSR